MDGQSLVKVRCNPHLSKDRWSYKSRFLERELNGHGVCHHVASTFPDVFCLAALVDARVGVTDTLVVCNNATEKDRGATAGTSLVDKLEKGSVLHIHSSWQHISCDLLTKERSYIRGDLHCLLADLTDDMYNNSLNVDVYGKFVPVPMSALLKAVCFDGKLHVRLICNTDDLLLALEELLDGHTFCRGVVTLPDRSEPWMRRTGGLFFRAHYSLGAPERFSRWTALPQPKGESVVDKFPSSLSYLRDDFVVNEMRADEVDDELRRAFLAAKDAILGRFSGGQTTMLTGMAMDLEACAEVDVDMQARAVLCYRVASVLDTIFTPITRSGRRNATPVILGLAVDSLRLFEGMYRRAREPGGAEGRRQGTVAAIERAAAAKAVLRKSEEQTYFEELARRMVGARGECAAGAEVWEGAPAQEEAAALPLASAYPAQRPAVVGTGLGLAVRDDRPHLIRPAQQLPAPALHRGPPTPASARAASSAAPVMSIAAFLRLWGDVCERERLVGLELECAQQSRFEGARQLQRAAYDTAAGMSTLDLLARGREHLLDAAGGRLQRLRSPPRTPEPVQEPQLRSVRLEDVCGRSFEQDCNRTFLDILDGLYRDKAYALIEKYLHILKPRGAREEAAPEQTQLSAGDVETILRALQAEGPEAGEAEQLAAEAERPVEAAQQPRQQPRSRMSVVGLFQRGRSRRDAGADSAAFWRQRHAQARIREAMVAQLRRRALRALDVFVCTIDGALVAEQEHKARSKAEEQDRLRRSKAFRVRRERVLVEEPPLGGALWGRMIGDAAPLEARAGGRSSGRSVDERQAECVTEDGAQGCADEDDQELRDDEVVQEYVDQRRYGGLGDPRDDELLDDDPMDDELLDGDPRDDELLDGEPRDDELLDGDPMDGDPRDDELLLKQGGSMLCSLIAAPRASREPPRCEPPLGVSGSSRVSRAAPPPQPQPSIALSMASSKLTRRRLEAPPKQQRAAAPPLLLASTAPLSRQLVKRRAGRRQSQSRPPAAAVLISAVHEVTVERRARPASPAAAFCLASEGGEWCPEEAVVPLDSREEEEEEEEQRGGGLHPTSLERLLAMCANPPAGPAARVDRSSRETTSRSVRRSAAGTRSLAIPSSKPLSAPEQLALLAVPIKLCSEKSLPCATTHRGGVLEAEQLLQRLRAQHWRAGRRAVRRASSVLVMQALVGGALLALGRLVERAEAGSAAEGRCAPESPPYERESPLPPAAPAGKFVMDGQSPTTLPVPLAISGAAAMPRSPVKAHPQASTTAPRDPVEPHSGTSASAVASEHVLMHVSTKEHLAGRAAKYVSSQERRFVSRDLVQRAADTRLKDAQRGLTYFDVLRRSEPISAAPPPQQPSGGDERLAEARAPGAAGERRRAAVRRQPARAASPTRPTRARTAPKAAAGAGDDRPAVSSVIFVESESEPPPCAPDERQLLCLTGRLLQPEAPRRNPAPAAGSASPRYVHRIMGCGAAPEDQGVDLWLGTEVFVRGPVQSDDRDGEERERGGFAWMVPSVAPPEPQ